MATDVFADKGHKRSERAEEDRREVSALWATRDSIGECRGCLEPGLERSCCHNFYCNTCYCTWGAIGARGCLRTPCAPHRSYAARKDLPRLVNTRADKQSYCPNCHVPIRLEESAQGLETPSRGEQRAAMGLSIALIITPWLAVIAYVQFHANLPATTLGFTCADYTSTDRWCVKTKDYFGDHGSAPVESWERCTPNGDELGCTCGPACVFDACANRRTHGLAGVDFLRDSFHPSEVILQDDFEDGLNETLWVHMTGGTLSTACGVARGDLALRFRGAGRRELQTRPIRIPNGGRWRFWMIYGSGQSGCASVEGGRVQLAYSVDNGLNWVPITLLDRDTFRQSSFVFTEVEVPPGAWSNATVFKWFQPLYYAQIDMWAIDTISLEVDRPAGWATNPAVASFHAEVRRSAERTRCCQNCQACREIRGILDSPDADCASVPFLIEEPAPRAEAFEFILLVAGALASVGLVARCARIGRDVVHRCCGGAWVAARIDELGRRVRLARLRAALRRQYADSRLQRRKRRRAKLNDLRQNALSHRLLSQALLRDAVSVSDSDDSDDSEDHHSDSNGPDSAGAARARRPRSSRRRGRSSSGSLEDHAQWGLVWEDTVGGCRSGCVTLGRTICRWCATDPAAALVAPSGPESPSSPKRAPLRGAPRPSLHADAAQPNERHSVPSHAPGPRAATRPRHRSHSSASDGEADAVMQRRRNSAEARRVAGWPEWAHEGRKWQGYDWVRTEWCAPLGPGQYEHENEAAYVDRYLVSEIWRARAPDLATVGENGDLLPAVLRRQRMSSERARLRARLELAAEHVGRQVLGRRASIAGTAGDLITSMRAFSRRETRPGHRALLTMEQLGKLTGTPAYKFDATGSQAAAAAAASSVSTDSSHEDPVVDSSGVLPLESEFLGTEDSFEERERGAWTVRSIPHRLATPVPRGAGAFAASSWDSAPSVASSLPSPSEADRGSRRGDERSVPRSSPSSMAAPGSSMAAYGGGSAPPELRDEVDTKDPSLERPSVVVPLAHVRADSALASDADETLSVHSSDLSVSDLSEDDMDRVVDAEETHRETQEREEARAAREQRRSSVASRFRAAVSAIGFAKRTDPADDRSSQAPLRARGDSAAAAASSRDVSPSSATGSRFHPPSSESTSTLAAWLPFMRRSSQLKAHSLLRVPKLRRRAMARLRADERAVREADLTGRTEEWSTARVGSRVYRFVIETSSVWLVLFVAWAAVTHLAAASQALTVVGDERLARTVRVRLAVWDAWLLEYAFFFAAAALDGLHVLLLLTDQLALLQPGRPEVRIETPPVQLRQDFRDFLRTARLVVDSGPGSASLTLPLSNVREAAFSSSTEAWIAVVGILAATWPVALLSLVAQDSYPGMSFWFSVLALLRFLFGPQCVLSLFEFFRELVSQCSLRTELVRLRFAAAVCGFRCRLTSALAGVTFGIPVFLFCVSVGVIMAVSDSAPAQRAREDFFIETLWLLLGACLTPLLFGAVWGTLHSLPVNLHHVLRSLDDGIRLHVRVPRASELFRSLALGPRGSASRVPGSLQLDPLLDYVTERLGLRPRSEPHFHLDPHPAEEVIVLIPGLQRADRLKVLLNPRTVLQKLTRTQNRILGLVSEESDSDEETRRALEAEERREARKAERERLREAARTFAGSLCCRKGGEGEQEGVEVDPSATAAATTATETDEEAGRDDEAGTPTREARSCCACFGGGALGASTTRPSALEPTSRAVGDHRPSAAHEVRPAVAATLERRLNPLLDAADRALPLADELERAQTAAQVRFQDADGAEWRGATGLRSRVHRGAVASPLTGTSSLGKPYDLDLTTDRAILTAAGPRAPSRIVRRADARIAYELDAISSALSVALGVRADASDEVSSEERRAAEATFPRFSAFGPNGAGPRSFLESAGDSIPEDARSRESNPSAPATYRSVSPPALRDVLELLDPDGITPVTGVVERDEIRRLAYTLQFLDTPMRDALIEATHARHIDVDDADRETAARYDEDSRRLASLFGTGAGGGGAADGGGDESSDEQEVDEGTGGVEDRADVRPSTV